MSADERFPDDLVWCSDGHVSDVVVTAVADGQSDLVPQAALEHVDSCPACTGRTVDALTLSLTLGSRLDTAEAWARPEETPAASPTLVFHFPIPALGAAVVVALVGTAPMLLQVPALFSGVFRSLPVLVRGVRVSAPVVAQEMAVVLSITSALVAAACLYMGWMVARLAPQYVVKGRAS